MKKITVFTLIALIVSVFVLGSCYPPGDEPPPEDPYIFDGTVSGWVGDPAFTLQTSPAPPSGGKFLQGTTATGVMVFLKTGINLDLSSYAGNGVLHLELYVSDVSKVSGGYFEFSSAGASDTQEFNFGPFGSTVSLTNGWNTLELPFSTHGSEGGTCNLAAIDYIRVFVLSGETITVGLGSTWVHHSGS
jgi:hypothetical protein